MENEIYHGSEKGLYDYETFWEFMSNLGHPFDTEPLDFSNVGDHRFQLWHFCDQGVVVRYNIKNFMGGPVIVKLSGKEENISQMEKIIKETAKNEPQEIGL
jgi:hypothetical protein